MLKKLLDWDREALIFLNGLRNGTTDTFWATITEIHFWIPLFLLFIVLLIYRQKRVKGLIQVTWVIALVLFITTITHWVKSIVGRVRPNNEEALAPFINILKQPTDFSFFSGHASSSFAITLMVFLFLRNNHRWGIIFFFWPILFSASRIFVGVHYPLDILIGAIVGILSAILFHKVYKKFITPYSG